MKNPCFSINRNKLISAVIIAFGIGTLAYSQLQTSEVDLPNKPEEAMDLLSEFNTDLETRIKSVLDQSSLLKFEDLSVQERWNTRSSEIVESVKSIASEILETKEIFHDLRDSSGGNLDDAMPAFKSVYKKMRQLDSELVANEKLLEVALEDYADFGKKINPPTQQNDFAQLPKSSASQSRIADVINATEAIALTPSSKYSPATQKLQGDMQRARSNIQGLAKNLNETESLTDNLERDNQFLTESINAGDSGVEVVRSAFSRLRSDLRKSRSELSDTKRKMVEEQGKSTALINSITQELERSRNELQNTQDLAQKAQEDRKKLDSIESRLKVMQNKINAVDSSKGQISDGSVLAELPVSMDAVLADLQDLKAGAPLGTTAARAVSSETSQVPSGKGNNELVNKLLVDLSKAQKEADAAKSKNIEQRNSLNTKIALLEDKLKATNLELSTASKNFQDLNEEMAKREFDFASTIRQLEEEAQVAQKALEDASRGKLPAVPFIEEMERNLADSEKRVLDLSKKFDAEKAQATDVIASLQVELENALIRQRRSMDQLARREVELKGKNEELRQLNDDKKLLEEELEVVKVLSSQLQDLNSVLEQTKEAQNLQTVNTDQVVLSLRDELNKAKIELTFEKEENESLLRQSGAKIQSLEAQLQLLRDKLIEEQENLSRQSLESKDLIVDLKSELDRARDEISRMQSIGATDSIETKQAVSQLQEALGTIRILKESLEESEKANLEIDSLRAEVADSMTRQIAQMKVHEEDRSKLKDKITDLETEILIYRDKDASGSLESRNLITTLNENLSASNLEIARMKDALRNAEALGITNLLELQEELALEESSNQELRARIDQLESELLQANEKTNELQNILRSEIGRQNIENSEFVSDLKNQLKDSNLEVQRLKSEIVNGDKSGIANLIDLQDELASEELMNQELRDRIEKLELDLYIANEKTNELENALESEMSKEDSDRSELVNQLNQQLEDSNLEVERLKAAVEEGERLGLSNLLELQEELAFEESNNQNFSKKIEQLELELLTANEKTHELEKILEDEMSEDQIKNSEIISDLKQQLETSNLEVERLQAEIKDGQEKGNINVLDLQEKLAKEESLNQELNLQIQKLENEMVELKDLLSSKEKSQKSSELTASIINDLENSLVSAENTIANLVDELNQTKSRHSQSEEQTQLVIQGLQDSLAEAGNKVVSLEKELGRLIEGNMAENDRDIELSDSITSDLENALANAEKTIAELQDQLASRDSTAKPAESPDDQTVITGNKLLGYDAEGIKNLEEELMEAQLNLELLENKSIEERDARLLIQSKLEDAIANAETNTNDDEDNNGSSLAGYKMQLQEKDQNINELETQLAESVAALAEKEAELELASAMNEVSNLDYNESKMIEGLKAELAELRKELLNTSSVPSPELASNNDDMRSKLEEAIAESFELQAQLDETQRRLSTLENSRNPNDEIISEYISIIDKAQLNEKKAIDEINALTTALENSEQLRQELESLLDEFQSNGIQQEEIANDPKVLELQKELLLLQEGLRAARKFKDPKVAELEDELANSKEETAALKDDFKNAMRDFVRLRNEVELIEQDNQRLKDQNLAGAKSEADRQIIDLKNQVAGLADQNSLLKLDLDGRDRRIEDLKNQMIANNQNPSIVANLGTSDSGQLRSRVIGLESSLQAARDAQNRAKMDADRLSMELQQSRQREATLESSLRNALANGSSVPAPSQNNLGSVINAGLSNAQIIELENLKQQNKRLQDQLASASANADRDILEKRIRDLNQRNLTAQVQLDQERKRSKDLERELEDAKNIKRGIIEKGESASLKADLLNEELANARNRVDSLEKALIAAREAIRVLRSGGNNRSMINVSMNNPAPRVSSLPSSLTRRSSVSSVLPASSSSYTPRYQPSSLRGLTNLNANSTPQVTQVPTGNASLDLKVEVQFLNNRNRPSSFTEFFLVESDLNKILEDARIRIPINQGVQSYGELWARSVQRGYRFPGVAANIRNALATTSLLRLKTNSVGEAKLQNIKPGSYYLIGASTLGQVGVVWSKPIRVQSGTNKFALGLGDALWAE